MTSCCPVICRHTRHHSPPTVSVGLTASASVVIDERGRAVSQGVVEQGGLGAIDRLYLPGQIRSLDGGRQPAPLLGGDACARLRSEEEGGFDPRLRYVVDWDCWLRLSRKWPVAWLARPTVQVRWHPASETHRFKTGLADLDETARMLETLFGLDLKDRSRSHPPAPCRARSSGPGISEPGPRCPSRGHSRAARRPF